MDGRYSRMDEEFHPRLLDLIPKEKEWGVVEGDHHAVQGSGSHGRGVVSDEKKLELRLGPPGVEDWTLSGAPKNYKSPAKPAVPSHNTSQKRSAPAPVVGWPPIRSFRKNIASSSSSKQALPPSESQNAVVQNNNVVKREKMVESCHKSFFVKINMDGVPIGRKVDLKAYDSYEKLSVAVDELFRGLLAAQRDSCGTGREAKSNQEEEKAITGLLDGSGEYTLVYEDNEGDRMLVGDVPWHMFVSTVKRLRVLKRSELSKLCLGGGKQEKIQL